MLQVPAGGIAAGPRVAARVLLRRCCDDPVWTWGRTRVAATRARRLRPQRIDHRAVQFLCGDRSLRSHEAHSPVGTRKPPAVGSSVPLGGGTRLCVVATTQWPSWWRLRIVRGTFSSCSPRCIACQCCSMRITAWLCQHSRCSWQGLEQRVLPLPRTRALPSMQRRW